MRSKTIEKEYEVTFWTEPTRFRLGRIEKRYFKARTMSEAVYDAEDKHPDWSIIAVKEVKKNL